MRSVALLRVLTRPAGPITPSMSVISGLTSNSPAMSADAPPTRPPRLRNSTVSSAAITVVKWRPAHGSGGEIVEPHPVGGVLGCCDDLKAEAHGHHPTVEHPDGNRRRPRESLRRDHGSLVGGGQVRRETQDQDPIGVFLLGEPGVCVEERPGAGCSSLGKSGVVLEA